MFPPTEGCGGQRHPEQHDGGPRDDGRPGQPLPPSPSRCRGIGTSAAQWLLDETHGQIGQQAGDQQNDPAVLRRGVRTPGVGEPEDQQRPVPQIERVRHRAQRDQRRGRQQPAGKGQSAMHSRVARAIGRGQNQQHRSSYRHQRPGTGELRDAVDQRTAGQHRRQSDGCQYGPKPHRQPDSGHQRARQDADKQFPGAGEAVVVGRCLVGVVGRNRVAERGDGQNAQQDDEHRSESRAQRSTRHCGKHQHQGEQGDVELALHRHRPDVLQRRYRLARAQVVRRRRGQFPILEVTQARQALISERLPAGLGLDRDGQYRGGGEHHDQCRQKPTGEPFHLRPRCQRGAGRQRGA